MSYVIVDLEQGTREWRNWRKQGIGASDAPVIMGENPWKKADQLLSEKLNKEDKDFQNAAMARGTALEPEARRRFEEIRKIKVQPVCLQSKKHDWLRASVDGLALDGSAVVEIKCGESVYKKASTKQIPTYYMGQLQHILAVTGLDRIDFFCYLPDRPEIALLVYRNDSYIERLLAAEKAFWDNLQRLR
jgi:putative phage-type endonuclease